MRVLVVNAGSSSLKLSLLDAHDESCGPESWTRPAPSSSPPPWRKHWPSLPAEPEIVAHRIVHGGERFRAATRLDADVLAALRELTELAPLHQPKSLAAVEAVSLALPAVQAVACFDTAFHATPACSRGHLRASRMRGESATACAATASTGSRIRTRRGAPASSRPGRSRLVTCHLGAGASLCAVLDGRSVDTTMGFTPLEGLVMATRAGSVDPGLLLWLQQHEGMPVDEIADALEHDSGLLGLSGTSDMREVLARDDAQARLALGVYLHRLRAGIGAMAATLDGLDTLVFTGGVGERSARIRELACAGLSYLGVGIDASRNGDPGCDSDVSAAGSSVAVLVVHAREDLEIAGQARALLAARVNP